MGRCWAWVCVNQFHNHIVWTTWSLTLSNGSTYELSLHYLHRTGRLHLIALYFIAFTETTYFFSKLKIRGDIASSESIGTIFPTAIVHCMSLYHFGNPCNIANLFIIITFLMMIFDVPSMSHWSFRQWLACFFFVFFLAENCIKVHAHLRHNATTCLTDDSIVAAL